MEEKEVNKEALIQRNLDAAVKEGSTSSVEAQQHVETLLDVESQDGVKIQGKALKDICRPPWDWNSVLTRH